MPRGDGTGPMGNGPIGRGRGDCRYYGMQDKSITGYGSRANSGCGGGRRRNNKNPEFSSGRQLGLGYGMMSPNDNYAPNLTPGMENQYLETRASFLENALSSIKKRIEKLKEKPNQSEWSE